MMITPQVAPMANQAFETPHFILFFFNHPNVKAFELQMSVKPLALNGNEFHSC